MGRDFTIFETATNIDTKTVIQTKELLSSSQSRNHYRHADERLSPQKQHERKKLLQMHTIELYILYYKNSLFTLVKLIAEIIHSRSDI